VSGANQKPVCVSPAIVVEDAEKAILGDEGRDECPDRRAERSRRDGRSGRG
jgi:hypothetical protein